MDSVNPKLSNTSEYWSYTPESTLRHSFIDGKNLFFGGVIHSLALPVAAPLTEDYSPPSDNPEDRPNPVVRDLGTIHAEISPVCGS